MKNIILVLLFTVSTAWAFKPGINVGEMILGLPCPSSYDIFVIPNAVVQGRIFECAPFRCFYNVSESRDAGMTIMLVRERAYREGEESYLVLIFDSTDGIGIENLSGKTVEEQVASASRYKTVSRDLAQAMYSLWLMVLIDVKYGGEGVVVESSFPIQYIGAITHQTGLMTGVAFGKSNIEAGVIYRVASFLERYVSGDKEITEEYILREIGTFQGKVKADRNDIDKSEPHKPTKAR